MSQSPLTQALSFFYGKDATAILKRLVAIFLDTPEYFLPRRQPLCATPSPSNRRRTHAFGVVVPDLPGCYSAGYTPEDADANAKESAGLWLEAVIEDGGSVPQPSAPEALKEAHPEWADWLWSAVEVDVPSKPDRID